MAPYSMDLRKRVGTGVGCGDGRRERRGEVRREPGVGESADPTAAVKRGRSPPRQQNQVSWGARLAEVEERRLAALITAQPDATVWTELRDALPTAAAVEHPVASDCTLGIDRQKKTVHADEQRRPDVVTARGSWRTWQPLRDVRQYVFLDECGVTTDLLRRYGRRPARRATPRSHTPCGHLGGAHGGGGVAARGPRRSRGCSTARSTIRASSRTSNKSWCPRSDPATSWCSTIWWCISSRRFAQR